MQRIIDRIDEKLSKIIDSIIVILKNPTISGSLFTVKEYSVFEKTNWQKKQNFLWMLNTLLAFPEQFSSTE